MWFIVFRPSPKDEDVTVYILFAAKIEADTINMEQLVYHVFSVRKNTSQSVWVTDMLNRL